MQGNIFPFLRPKTRGNEFQKLAIWGTIFVGTKPENVEEWFPNEGKGVFDKYFLTYFCRGSQKFKYISKISKLPNLEWVSQKVLDISVQQQPYNVWNIFLYTMVGNVLELGTL